MLDNSERKSTAVQEMWVIRTEKDGMKDKDMESELIQRYFS